jgi:hypothetical protein
LTQEGAAKIFEKLAASCLVRHFEYLGDGYISYNTRGLIDIDLILQEYGIDYDELEIEDEFERFYNSLSPEELKQMEEDAKKWREEEAKLPKTEFKGFNF